MTGRDAPVVVVVVVVVVVMGVSGVGKSTVAEALAARLGGRYLDADSLHSIEAVQKMSSGIPLTDGDRWPWLARVGAVIAEADARDERIVVACSALRRVYRDALRAHAGAIVFVHLGASSALLRARMGVRAGSHFMPPELLDSQMATLEHLGADEHGFEVSALDPVEVIVDNIVRSLA